MFRSDELLNNFTLTSHAMRVAQQRRITPQTVQCVLYNADVRNHRDEGKLSYAISRKKIKQLQAQGYPSKIIENVHTIVVPVEPVNRTVISVWLSYKKSNLRDYKQCSTFSSRQTRSIKVHILDRDDTRLLRTECYNIVRTHRIGEAQVV